MNSTTVSCPRSHRRVANRATLAEDSGHQAGNSIASAIFRELAPECLEVIVGNQDLVQIIKSAGDDPSSLKDIIRRRSNETSASPELKRLTKRVGS